MQDCSEPHETYEVEQYPRFVAIASLSSQEPSPRPRNDAISLDEAVVKPGLGSSDICCLPFQHAQILYFRLAAKIGHEIEMLQLCNCNPAPLCSLYCCIMIQWVCITMSILLLRALHNLAQKQGQTHFHSE
jgi:hypothetical protein